MSAKRHESLSDDRIPSPPCTVPIAEAEARVRQAVEKERKQLGQLNGPWVRAYKFTQTFIFPLLLAGGGWCANEMRIVNNRIVELEKNAAVLQQIVAQIQINTETLHKHDRDISAIQAQFDTRTAMRDREMNAWKDENRTAHSEILMRLEKFGDRIDRLGERFATFPK